MAYYMYVALQGDDRGNRVLDSDGSDSLGSSVTHRVTYVVGQSVNTEL